MDNTDRIDSESDEWSEWLLGRRHGGDADYRRLVRAATQRYADRVLDLAGVAGGMTLADIGAGEGLIAFRAIERIGLSLRAILTDISAPLLNCARAIARQRGVENQCTFFECPATKLLGIADDSVDIVTTRAVLAYVADKGAALREFHRVLKMGGRLSICEPIFQDDAFEAMALRKMIEARPPQALNQFLPLLHRWKAAQFPDTEELIAQNPISNFSERDLIRLVGNSGFAGIHMEFHVDIMPSLITSWEVFLGCSPHPWAPSLATILEKQFTTEERQFFEQVMRPIVETKQFAGTEHIAYITAKKLPVQTRAVH